MKEPNQITFDLDADTLRTLVRSSQNILTQDNRATAEPIFLVRVLDRDFGVPDGQDGDGICFITTEETGDTDVFFHDKPDPEKWQKLYEAYCNDDDESEFDYDVVKYKERWLPVQAFFTEDAAKNHIEENRHRYSCYFGIDTYVDTLFRNPEMIAVRKLLQVMGEQLKEAQEILKKAKK